MSRRSRLGSLCLGAGIALLALAAARADGAEPADAAEPPGPLEIIGARVEPGTKQRLVLVVGRSFAGADLETPVVVTRGLHAGPTLCLTAGIHGDEVNGVEIVRRVVQDLDPTALRGSVIAVPIVNLPAFRRGSRYLPDRRDLNRFFPGSTRGSAASRIAYSLFNEIVVHCSALVDFHTGSFHRTNIPHLRADLRNRDVENLARGFGTQAVLHKPGRPGTLRRAASDAGIPAITLEAGEPARFSETHTAAAVAGVRRLATHLGLLPAPDPHGESSQVLYGRSLWARANEGGILISRVSLGEDVVADQVLGVVTNPLTEETSLVRAPETGRVVGKAFDQVVMPGFAAFHIAVPGDLEELGASPDEAEDVHPDDREGLDLDERPE